MAQHAILRFEKRKAGPAGALEAHHERKKEQYASNPDINNTDIPQYKIEAIARCIMPDILAFYESEEGQREFAEWKKRRESGRQERKNGK